MELADFAGTPGRAIADPIPARSLSGEKTVIEQYLAALGDALVGQGVVVWLNGHLAGMEWISRREVYATVCTQVVRSYILDALRRQHQGTVLPAHQETAYRFIGGASLQDPGAWIRSASAAISATPARMASWARA